MTATRTTTPWKTSTREEDEDNIESEDNRRWDDKAIDEWKIRS